MITQEFDAIADESPVAVMTWSQIEDQLLTLKAEAMALTAGRSDRAYLAICRALTETSYMRRCVEVEIEDEVAA